MNDEEALQVITDYISGWVENNPCRILDTLNEDCVIIESHGPTYRGKQHVMGWLEGWTKSESIVRQWDILSFMYSNNKASFEWDFECTTRGESYQLKGISFVCFSGSKITVIHEYCMTQIPFEAPAFYS